MNFDELRRKHPQFIYEGFEILEEGKNLKVTFDFSISPDIKFKPTVSFPGTSKKNGLENLAFNLGMVELLSYWKATCSPQIIIRAGHLNEEQIKFWKNLLIKGLGEFFYTNKIDFAQKDLVEFEVYGKNQFSRFDGALKEKDLILVGGGKDSAVTLEVLSKSKRERTNRLFGFFFAVEEVKHTS